MAATKKQIATTTAPTGKVPPFGLRMLDGLQKKVEAAARKSGRSKNAEIVARLTKSFEVQGEALRMSDEDVERIAVRVAEILNSK